MLSLLLNNRNESQMTYIKYEFPSFATSLLAFASSFNSSKRNNIPSQFTTDPTFVDPNVTGLVLRDESGGKSGDNKPGQFITFSQGCEITHDSHGNCVDYSKYNCWHL